MINLIYFVVILGIIVFIHEGGHFLFAKLFKVYVYEFALGMGPRLFKKKSKNNETEYSIRAIPIGGFVRLAGEEVDDDQDIPKNRKLYSKPIWQRALVMFFGAGFNFISAIIILFAIGLIWGSPSNEPVISSVIKDNPAFLAGMREGDYVVKINNHHIATADDILIYLQVEDKSKPIIFTVKRNETKMDIEVIPIKETVDGNDVYKIGVTINGEVKHGFLDAVKYGFSKTLSLVKQMVITIKGLFTGNLSIKQLSGPIGIYNVVGDQRESGFQNIVFLVALLSINVGFINLIPLPAFDGGRLLFLLIEKIKGSPIKPKTENIIHSIGFFLLMALMLYITFNDILKFF